MINFTAPNAEFLKLKTCQRSLNKETDLKRKPKTVNKKLAK